MKKGFLKTTENSPTLNIVGKVHDNEFLILENSDDVLKFSEPYVQITAQKNIDAWFGFRSQNYRTKFNDYLVHEGINVAPETTLLAMRLMVKETDTSIIELCEMSDKIIYDKINLLHRSLELGKYVRVNSKGGLCPINTLDDLDSFEELENDSEIVNFIQYRTFKNKEALEIKESSVIIENDKRIDESFIKELKKYEIEKFSSLTEFKTRTLLFKDKDYLELFQKGIENGLRNICFETTGQDQHSLIKMNILLKTLLKMNADKKFKLFISTYNKTTKDIFQSKDNLEVINIKN